MKVVNGLQLMDLDDLIERCGRPAAICNALIEEVNNNSGFVTDFYCRITVDISIDGNCTIHNIEKPYRLEFIPLDLIEEKLITDIYINGLSSVQQKILSSKKCNRIDKLMATAESKYAEQEVEHANREHILKSTCCMFVYENNKLINVYTAIPSEVINQLLTKKFEYKCCRCNCKETPNSHSIDDYIPNMCYEIYKNNVKYYCNDCVNKYNLIYLKHVGN